MKCEKMKHPPHGIVQGLIDQHFEFVLFRRVHKGQVGHLHVHRDARERARRTESSRDEQRLNVKGHTLEKRGKVLEEV